MNQYIERNEKAIEIEELLRQAVIHFFTGGATEIPPVEQLSAPEPSTESSEAAFERPGTG